MLSLYAWNDKKQSLNSSFLLAIYDVLGVGTASVSLWFMVQKFYWMKVESIFNLIGILFSLASISTSFVVSGNLASIQSLTHILTLSLWTFSAFWAWRKTFNNVSNLFISEWGRNTESSEIEYLEQHF
uniref:Uncharacterized protein n=1 Tax=Caenorhabditis japonica TaxID=281687 RepID=A0A8R1E2P8_CAEJA